MSDELKAKLAAIEARAKAGKEKHKADVRYVQKNYPELAAFLTEMTREFGRMDYRVTFRGAERD